MDFYTKTKQITHQFYTKTNQRIFIENPPECCTFFEQNSFRGLQEKVTQNSAEIAQSFVENSTGKLVKMDR